MCPLCGIQTHVHCEVPAGRPYFLCPRCDLISLDPSLLLSPEQERGRYLQHRNQADDPDYRDFLNRVWDPLSSRLAPGSAGLDYGSGPNPVLGQMIQDAGFGVTLYDPFFHPELRAFDSTYDFIVCCETAEHFFKPGLEFDRFNRLLKPGGWIGIQTQMLDDRAQFASWYYHRDPTHVSFYSRRTMQWIAEHYGYTLEVVSERVVLFRERS